MANVVSARPEITVENIGKDDFFVIMASDGVWDVLSDQDACDLAMKPGIYGDHHKMAKAVAQEAIKKDSHDNTSALVFMFTWNRDGLAAILKAEKAAKKKIKAKVVDMFEDSD